MATQLWGVSRGEVDKDVTTTTGSATSADHVEVTIDLAVSISRLDAILSLERIIRRIEKDNWPPA